MSDYVSDYTCGSCEEFEFEGHDKKGYCKRYRAYYWDDDTCDHWVRSDRVYDSSSSGCFLTTACCEWKGLPDDCHELQVLRGLRDGWLIKQSYGKELVETYYQEAPAIVAAIEARSDKDQILSETYDSISGIVDLIEDGKNDEAVIRYLMLFHRLFKLTVA